MVKVSMGNLVISGVLSLLLSTSIGLAENSKPQETAKTAKEEKVEKPQEPALSASATALKAALEKTKDLHPETRTFYQENKFEPLWFKDKTMTPLGQHAIEVLKNAATEGLNPDDYQKAFSLDKEKDTDHADITLTNEVIHFINHVRVGRVPPGSSGNIIKVKSPKTTPVELLKQIQQDPKILDQLAPPQKAYQNLKNTLATFRKMQADNPDLPTLKDVALKKGVTDPEVINLRKLLILYGDLQGDATSNVFDESVEEALKKYQDRHTLDSDGVVGPSTRKSLNTSLQDQINTIIVNMERWRWLPDDLGQKHIIVNVGGFEVTAIKNDTVDLRIKAIVGAPITKTPLFYAPVQNIIINPAWHVPPGIMARQKLQKIINDPSYVYQAGMTVTDSSGNVVDPYQVDWEHDGMSYRLHQAPGARNALGRLKLNIKNPYTVYLHGTPEDKLFNHTIRNFSSGCVRLQRPVDLGAWVFDDEKQWNVEKINSAINAGSTQTVPINTPISVYFTYQTVWLNDSNTISFGNDHYHLDAPLMRLLKLSGAPESSNGEMDDETPTT